LEVLKKLQPHSDQNEDLRKNLDVSELNPHPGFATSIFVSWDSIADYFSLFDQYPLCKEDETSEELVNLAFSEARNWAKDYVNNNSFPPTDQQIVSVENKILESLKSHWSSASALSGQFDFRLCIKQTNDWSQNGAKDPRIFGLAPNPGKSVDYFLNSIGITFTIYPPFMIPYTEIYYKLYDGLPEWGYDEVDGMDVVETIFAVHEASGQEIELDIERLEDSWDISQVDF
jgi:hypothetical protein